MTYAELQTAIIEDSHRPDLTALVPRFIAEGEGMIRRDLVGYVLSYTLTEADRVTDTALYTLPQGTEQIRALNVPGRATDGLTRVAPDGLQRYADYSDPAVYCQYGNGTVAIVPNPATGATFDLVYFGTPDPLVNDADTNTLLEENESLYKSASLFWLYQNTQDRELGADQLDIYEGIMRQLNEQVARRVGGNTIQHSYNFNTRSAY